MVQFENTPKALANVSPRLERSDNPGVKPKEMVNPERVRRLANPYRVQFMLGYKPRVVASSNPGLKLANAFGVFSNSTTTFMADCLNIG